MMAIALRTTCPQRPIQDKCAPNTSNIIELGAGQRFWEKARNPLGLSKS